MSRVKYLLGLFFLFLLFSSTVYALTSEQQAIIEEKKQKITEKLSEKLAAAKGTEEYDVLIELTDASATGKFASVMKKYMSSTKRLAHHSLVYVGRADADTIVALMNEDFVKYVELQQEILPSADAVSYNVNATGAPLVWENTTGSGVKVAVLDTGIANHPDLNIAGGTSIVSPTYTDNDGHGTEVAGVLAATLNDAGLVGVAPNVSLYAVKIMETNTGNLSDAIDGLQWAIDNNMSIVVMSFGFDGFSNIFRDKVNTFYSNGGLSVAAAGNDGGTTVLYPAKYSKVIAVGATDENKAKASFSPSSVDIELVAGGVSVNTTTLGNSYGTVSGTSFSAPAVAGVIALIWQINPTLNNTELRTKLHQDALDLGETGKDQSFGYGLVRINTSIGNYTSYLDSYWYEVNKWFENGSQEEYASGYGTFDEVTYDDGRYLVIRKYEDGSRVYEELRVVGEYQGISALATFNTTITATDDAYVNQTNANQNYGSNTELINWEDVNQVWVFLQYSISSLPSTANVIDADIIVYPTQAPTSDTFTVNNIDASWSESDITWNNRPTGAGALINPTITNADANNDYVIGNGEITTAVSNDKTNNRNSSFQFESGNPTAAIFKSSEAALNKPRLTIVYTDGSVDCNGTIQVVAENSQLQPLSNIQVRLNNVVNGTTDSTGVRNIQFRPAYCGLAQNISVYCNDNTTFCGNQSTTLNPNWDNDTVRFTCNICQAKKNVYISLSDITIRGNASGEYNITALLHVDNVNINNLNVSFFGQGSDGLISKSENKSINVNAYTDTNVSVKWNLQDIKYVHVYVDSNNAVKETSETDNYVLRPYINQQIPANIEVKTGYSAVDEIVLSYLDLFFDNATDANITIAIGQPEKNSIVKDWNQYTQKNFGWGFTNIVQFNGRQKSENAYIGLVGAFKNTSTKRVVLAYGNDIAGTIAAVKRMVDGRNTLFFSEQNQTAILIDEYDLKGISVLDVMLSKENKGYYKQNSEGFRRVVEKILNNNQFELDIRTVKTFNDNTTLRLKHVNADYSKEYKDAVVSSQIPVVLSRGLWSNLLSWETFGKELTVDAQSPRDVWLIEITGGPGQDCENCVNYNFTNMTQFYVPALLSGVENYTDQHALQYVGFSNGCRAALSSLDMYDASGKNNSGYYFDQNTGTYKAMNMSANLVRDFIGVGCPGNFTGDSTMKLLLQDLGDSTIKGLERKGLTHFSMYEISDEACSKANLKRNPKTGIISCLIFLKSEEGDDKISAGLFRNYYDFMNSTNDIQPGTNITVNNLTIIFGITSSFSDEVVTGTDAEEIFGSINASDKKLCRDYFDSHEALPKSQKTLDIIKKRLNGQSLSVNSLCQSS